MAVIPAILAAAVTVQSLVVAVSPSAGFAGGLGLRQYVSAPYLEAQGEVIGQHKAGHVGGYSYSGEVLAVYPAGRWYGGIGWRWSGYSSQPDESSARWTRTRSGAVVAIGWHDDTADVRVSWRPPVDQMPDDVRRSSALEITARVICGGIVVLAEAAGWRAWQGRDISGVRLAAGLGWRW